MAQHSSAVVLGASMAGLLAARVLSNHFERITLVDRDRLPDDGVVRKGVPQAAHAHGLLASGYRVLDAYFPGLMDELGALGAPRGDVVGDFLWFQYGHWKLRHQSGLRGITVSRPCLEMAVRRRVCALPNVNVVEGVDAVTPTFDAASARVTGLRARFPDGHDRQLEAELVVDATGRGSQSPKWLEAWGFGRPDELHVKINVGYATREFERRPGEFFDSMGGIVAGTPPGSTRLAAVLAAERFRWVVTLVGCLGDFPPTDDQGWAAFARSLPEPCVYQLVTSARPLTDIVSYRFPANQRRLFEKMKRLPEGFLVLGDALCSFNPIYGQGMSVAAMEARALDESLAPGLTGVGRRFHAHARKIVDTPWLIATGEDLRYPQVDGPRSAASAIMNRYFERVHAIASEDGVVCRKFFDVLNLLAPPPVMLGPSIGWRVLTRPLPKGPGSPVPRTASAEQRQTPASTS